MEAVANFPEKVQTSQMAMDSRRETTARLEIPAKTTKRAGAAGAVAAMAAAAAGVIAVTRTGDLFTHAVAVAPKKMGDIPTERHGIKKKISSVPQSRMGEGSDLGKIPLTKT